MAYKEDLSIAPMLAEDYKIEDGGRKYIFNLRKGVLFHNGIEMTSAHVKWSWDRYLDPETRWLCRSWYDGTTNSSVKITSIETPSPYKVIFNLEKPSYIFLHRMAHLQCITAVIHPSSVDEKGEWIKPVGTGPFELAEWRRGEYIELKKFDEYSPRKEIRNGLSGKKEVLINSVRFLIIPDASIAKAALQAGDIDVAVSLPISLYRELKLQQDLELIAQPTLYWMTLLIQNNQGILNNPLIRQALSHAIDRESLANFSTQGMGEMNSSAIPMESPYYDDFHSTWYEYDVNKARKLLKEAGYNGELLKIQTNRKQLHLYENAIILHAMLRDAGFNIELEVLDWASQLNNFYSGEFQLSAFDYSARIEPFLNYQLFDRERGTVKKYGWQNPRVREMLNKLDQIFIPEERAVIFRSLHSEMKNDIPLIGLYNLYKMFVVNKTVNGFEGWNLVIPRFWGVAKRPLKGGEK
ncbi:MAG: hypothetical protein JKY84_13885 [Emcibacteraceae bacterium]|nr:hypothetical protein [Emcibacteraceae bacterium]